MAALSYNNFGTGSCGLWSYAGGYNLLSIHYKGGTGSYAPTGVYALPFSNARISWINSDTPVTFTYDATAITVHQIAYLGGSASYLGYTVSSCYSGGIRAGSTVTLNRSNLDSGAGYYADPFWRQFAAAHESGHNIGLIHSSIHPAIMNDGVSWTLEFTPWPESSYNGPVSDDECGVNHLYSSTAWPPLCGY
jgi:hypothetical protein